MFKAFLKKIIVCFTVMIIAVVLEGCGLFSSQARRHFTEVKPTELPPLLIPPKFSKEKPFTPAMPIPEIQASSRKNDQKFDPAFVAPLQNLTMESGHHIYQLVNSVNGHMIQSTENRDKLWQKVLSFLQNRDIPILSQNEQQYTIKTEWFSPRTITTLTKKTQQEIQFLFHIKKAPSSQTMWLIECVEYTRSIKNNSQSETLLVEKNSSTREIFLKHLMIYLVAHLHASLDTSEPSKFTSDSASITADGNDNTILKMTVSFKTAWTIISDALSKTDIQVTHKSQEAGIFYINIRSLLNSTENSDNKKSRTAVDYRLVISPVNDGVYISIEKNTDTVADNSISQIILKNLYDTLKEHYPSDDK